MDPARAKRSSWLNDQRVRGLAYQILLIAAHRGVGLGREFITLWLICGPAAFRWASVFGTMSPASTSIFI